MSQSKSFAKMFFLHLLSMVTLYATAGAFIGLTHGLVDLYLPDTLNDYRTADNIKDGLKVSLSFLIVMFPVYLGTLSVLQKLYTKNKTLRELKSRTWLVYLTLFICALILLFSTVFTLNTLLDGELTARFLLKLLSILFIALAVGGYYLHDIKK